MADPSNEALVQNLNRLLTALDLGRIVLESPLDLTPSLLLILLESILSERLPVSQEVRQSRSPSSRIQVMKVFLGVLENDVLQRDVGISDIDPRSLAAGEWDEVVFIGEIMCWLGQKMGIISRDTSAPSGELAENSHSHRSKSPSYSPTIIRDSVHSLQPHFPKMSPTTTISNLSGDFLQMSSPRAPRCIHEVETPSPFLSLANLSISSDFQDQYDAEKAQNGGDSDDDDKTKLDDTSFASSTFCHCAEPSPSPPPVNSVRYTGWIDTVDDEEEIRSFETTRSYRTTTSSRDLQDHPILQPPSPRIADIVARGTSPIERRQALLTERAYLLSELAELARVRER